MARSFNGTTQYLSNAGAVLTAVPLTMACWFYSTSATTLQTLMSLGVSGANDNRFSLFASGATAGDPVQAQTRGTANASALSTTGYSINTWQHACGVFASATDRRAYVNGGGEGIENTSRTPVGINSTYLGALQGASPATFLVGRIAEPAIWNVALNASEIAALARGVSPLRIRPGNLKFYPPLYGVGSPEPDYIGGFLLTLNNAPTQADHAPVMPSFAYQQGWAGAFGGAAAGSNIALLSANMRGNFRNPSGRFING